MTLRPENLTPATPAAVPSMVPPRKTSLGDTAILRRLLRTYIGNQWPLLAFGIFCMIVTPAMQGELAGIINPAIKKIFLQKHADQLITIPLEIMGIMFLRAVSGFGEQASINTIAKTPGASDVPSLRVRS